MESCKTPLILNLTCAKGKFTKNVYIELEGGLAKLQLYRKGGGGRKRTIGKR